MAAMSAAEVVRPIPGTHATVRVEEDTGSVPRSPTGSWPSSTNGLRSSGTGGWLEPPVRTFWQILRTQVHEKVRDGRRIDAALGSGFMSTRLSKAARWSFGCRNARRSFVRKAIGSCCQSGVYLAL